MTDKLVDKSNPYPKPVDGSGKPPISKDKAAISPRKSPTSIVSQEPQQLALFAREVETSRLQLAELNAKLLESESNRRGDNERLLRELMDAKMTIARLETELRLRTEPPTDKPTPD